MAILRVLLRTAICIAIMILGAVIIANIGIVLVDYEAAYVFVLMGLVIMIWPALYISGRIFLKNPDRRSIK